MSDDEFTQHELHPSSPAPSYYGEVWDEGSQVIDSQSWSPLPSPRCLRSPSPAPAPPKPTTNTKHDHPASSTPRDAILPCTWSPTRPPALSAPPPRVPPPRIPLPHASPPRSMETIQQSRPTRRAALDSSRRTSDLFVEGGLLDSQTTDSQYVYHQDVSPPGDNKVDMVPARGAVSGCSGCAGHARTRVELSQTRHQLYEYVGRWVMAGARIEVLEREVLALQARAQEAADVAHE
ncbi:hypothetical protein VTO73DRAFT_8906 [Trametes versicolor]